MFRHFRLCFWQTVLTHEGRTEPGGTLRRCALHKKWLALRDQLLSLHFSGCCFTHKHAPGLREFHLNVPSFKTSDYQVALIYDFMNGVITYSPKYNMYLVPGRSSSASLWRTRLEQADNTPTSVVTTNIPVFARFLRKCSCRPTNPVSFEKLKSRSMNLYIFFHFPETRKSHAAIITGVLQQKKKRKFPPCSIFKSYKYFP